MKKLKVLFLDIETRPIESYTWGTYKQNVALNQIIKDWGLLSWAAKWHGQKQVMCESLKGKSPYNDKPILKKIWALMNEADVIIGQNSQEFDIKKLNAKFIEHGFKPPSSYKQFDTYKIAAKHFAFTSHKLEHMLEKVKAKHRKGKHKKFPGFELWIECLKGNKQAWNELEAYNKIDVIATEELFNKIIPWDLVANKFFFIHGNNECSCGSKRAPEKKGFAYTASGRYQRYRCLDCGAQTQNNKKEG